MYRKKTKAGIKKDSKVLIKAAKKLDADYIRVVFPFSKENLEEIRTFNGRIWNKDKKYWKIPLTLENLLQLKKYKYRIADSLRNWGNAEYVRRKTHKTLNFGKLKDILYPYQKEGVAFIDRNNGKALIADEMGLGKTLQAITYCSLYPQEKKILVICPASLKLNWAAEFRKWINRTDSEVIGGTKPYMLSTNIIIINYDIINYWQSVLKKYEFDIVILDESHLIKNNAAKRTKAVKAVCKFIPKKIALTGTPIESKPAEIYNSVHLINPTLFPNKWAFLQRYCNPKHNGFGWDFSGASNIEELHNILTKSVMIRRKKKDVLTDLPDKVYSSIPLVIDNKKAYTEAEHNFINYLKKGIREKVERQIKEATNETNLQLIKIDEKELRKVQEKKTENVTILQQIEELKQLAARGKLKSIIRWIEDFLEVNDKLVLFTTHRFMIDALEANFSNIAVKIDGSVANSERHKAVERFQKDRKIKLFLGNIKAAGVGLTLTASSNVAICEFPWTPGELNQAIDRVHRIGQKNTVNVHYLIAVDTIDEKILNLLSKKQHVVDAVIDGKVTENSSLLQDLINSYK